MTLTIIGGSLRSRALKSPKKGQTRPTTALVRKAVFDRLAPDIEGAFFLDLFAGSGAMGLEALSRGACHATFVENNKEAILCIKENLNTFDLSTKAHLLTYDVKKALETLYKKKVIFDIIYCDPPYALASFHLDILSFLDNHALLKPHGTLFLEEACPSSLDLQNLALTHLIYKDTRRFGKSLVHRYDFYTQR